MDSANRCVGCNTGRYKDQIGTSVSLCKLCPTGRSTSTIATQTVDGCNTCDYGYEVLGGGCVGMIYFVELYVLYLFTSISMLSWILQECGRKQYLFGV